MADWYDEPDSSQSEVQPRTAAELFWVKHQKYLEERGYELRPRYHKDWIPTRTRLEGLDFGFTFEDEIACTTAAFGVLDAVQTSTKRKVAIKITMLKTRELAVAQSLGAPELLADPRNHTVPVLDSFPVPGEEHAKCFMVMPYLQRFDCPKFHCRLEFADALHQVLEGIRFMHERNVAHGDACSLNFMMDATEVCPKGHHFTLPDCNDDGFTFLTTVPRCRTENLVRYYIIDFEGTKEYPAGLEAAVETDMRCQIKTSPEFNEPHGTSYNPFPLDIYNIGATFLKLCDRDDSRGHLGIEEFRPFLDEMMRPNPRERPTAADCLDKLERLLYSKDDLWRYTRVWGLMSKTRALP
ncbi:hypothetical protein BDZ89DRAFT_1019960 [Hymenopellis radicata]|nr:hypothetical protein BDZ89DRAFT_1019960 [Hymenopellis radicata]